MPTDAGVQFPVVDGRRSSTELSREVFARAASTADSALAEAIARESSWHTAYADHLRTLTARAAVDGGNASKIARTGLEALHERFEFVRHDGTAAPLGETVAETPNRATFDTRVVAGTADRVEDLVVPYRGRELRGREIAAQAHQWARDGVVEPSFVEAIERVLAHPEWLDLRGTSFALLGAGAEMGPTELLLRWGADVWAVDVPVQRVWDRLEGFAASGAGRLHVPTRPDGTPGCDLIAEPTEVRAWLEGIEGPVTIGNYAYADGADFVRVAMAADAVMLTVQRNRGTDVGLAYLATPTDVFAVPIEAVEHARRRLTEGGTMARVGALAHRVSGGRAFVPNYRETMTTADGRELGIADCLVLQQGPNYAMAKRLQRWRALVAKQDGFASSVHVAPATRTRSVTKNRILAAAYAGAHVVDVEPFEPATSRAIMAALLVHDLHHAPGRAGGTGEETEHDLTDAAAHSGLWRVAWETRSALGVAVAAGARTLVTGG